jgi:hypothetical protein
MKLYHSHVFEMAEKAADLALEVIDFFNKDLPEDKRRPGGYLAVIDVFTEEVVMIIMVGKLPDDPEKRKKYLDYSIKKGTQLLNYINQGHHTSFESSHAGFPQGAVYASEYIFSFSGQESEVDEAISYILAARFPNYQDPDQAKKGIANLKKTIEHVTGNLPCLIADKNVRPVHYDPFP